MPDERAAIGTDVKLGIWIGCALHLFQIPISMGFGTLLIFWAGATQLAYLVPAGIVASGQKRPGITKGLIVVGALTSLLNAGCAGVFFLDLGR